MATDGWDFLVDRTDLTKTKVAPNSVANAQLAEGDVLLAIESFALTANNMTYGALGDSLGYWQFFPAPEGWGRIPAWGFATVLQSRAEGIDKGARLFGYWPMSTHLVTRLSMGDTGITDVSPHRAQLPPTYNSYAPAPPSPGDDHRSLLQPLAATGFLLDDQLSEDADLTDLILSSASSKTALSLAFFAKQRGAWRVTGLTSAANLESVKATGLYDQVLAYDDLDSLTAGGPGAYVDFAGRREVNHGVHDRLAGHLKTSLIVGLTHRDATAAQQPRTGPKPAFFFAPDRIGKVMAKQGRGVMIKAVGDFAAASDWLVLRRHRGPDALAAVYQDVLSGRTRPEDGHIIIP